jgi:hypothetical protein
VAPAGGGGKFSVYWRSDAISGGERAFVSPDGVASVAVQRTYYEQEAWVGQKGWAWRIEGFDPTGVQVWSHSITLGGVPGAVLFDGPTVPNIPLTEVRLRYEVPSQGGVDLAIEAFEPEARRQFEPEPLEEPAKTPPVVIPLPYAPPAAPEAEPTQEPTPTRPTRPVVAPPVTRPAPVVPAAVPRTTTPTTPAGGVQPTPQLPPTKTPTTVHVVNGSQIPANGPQATPQGIAQELGRIENKLARLLNPSPRGGPDLTDRLGLIWSAIQALAEIINSTGASGEYRLSSPCVVDDNGQRVERVVEFEGALTAFGVLQNRIDALAALLQEHKDLKQPICRETPATGGQAVTVNFVQID